MKTNKNFYPSLALTSSSNWSRFLSAFNTTSNAGASLASTSEEIQT